MTTDELVGKLIELGGRLHVGDMEVIAEAVSRIRESDGPRFPLQLKDWDVFWTPHGTAPQPEDNDWVINALENGIVWARRRTRAEMETLSGEK